MTTLLSLHPSPLPSPKPTSPLLPPSSFSHLAPPSTDGPSRPLPTHQSLSQLRRSSATISPPPSKSLLLSSPSYEPSASPTTSPSTSSFADRGRSLNTGMLGVAWGSRRESEGQLEEVDQDVLRGESSSSRTGLEFELSLGSGEGSRRSPLLPSPRLVEEDDSFEVEGELRRPSKAWMLGQRSGSCDSSGTESSTMTTGSSASSHSSASTSTSSSTLASTASSLATPPVVYEDLAIPTVSSSSVEVHEEEVLVKIKKDKKGYGFGVLKGWLGSVKKDKGKERAKVVAPLPVASSSASSFAGGVGKLAPPLVLQDSSRPSNRLVEAVISTGNRDAENDTDEDEDDASRDEDETSETDDSTAAASSSTSTLRLHLSPSLGTVPLPSDSLPVPLPPPTRLSQLLSPLQTFPFPSSFRRSSPPPPTSPILPASPTTPTSPPARQSAGPTPPTLTPLQSLHLLSSQKLSLLVRPPPPAHPIFVAPEKKGSERRFPGSTNRLVGGSGGKKSRVRGLEVELGVRGLMRRLEKGGKASRDEVEGLVRLFKTRPVSLIRDSHGNFVASIGPSSSDLALDSPPPANISSSALQVAAPAAGSGILAFIARPTFEERVDVYLHDAASDGFITANVVTARGLGVMELEFSVGMEALAEEILSRAKGGSPMGRKSSLGLSLAVPGWRPTSIVDGGDTIPTGGRRSPTDGKRTIVEEEVVVEGPPKLADVTLTPVEASSNVVLPSSSSSSSSNNTTPTPIPSRLPCSPFSSSSNESSPTTPTQHPNLLSTPSPPPPHSDTQRVVSTSDPTPPPPRTKRFSPLSRQSFPPPTSSPIPESALDDDEDEDEDELPLAVLKQRASFLRSARTSPTLPSDEPLPPPLPQPKLVSAMRSASKDRVLRFSPDTVDHEQRERARREAEIKEREAREKEEEKERLRVEEEDKKRQERYRQEVAASRLRRESAKLGTVKGNHGNWEDLSSGGSGGSTPSGGSSGSAAGAPPRKQAKRSESSWTLREENVRSSAASTSSSNRRSVSTADLGTPRGSYHDRHSASYHERPPSLVSTTATSTPQSASPRSSVSSISRIDPRPHIAGLPPKRPSFSSFQDSGLTPSTSPALSSGPSSKFSSYSHQQQHPSSPHHSRHQPRSSLYLPQTSTPPPPQMMPTSFTSPHSLAMLAAGGGGAYPMPQQVVPYGYPQPYGTFVPAPPQNFGYNPYFPNGFVPQQQHQQQFYAPPPPQLQHQPQYHQQQQHHQGGHPSSSASATRESSSRSSHAGGSVHGRR